MWSEISNQKKSFVEKPNWIFITASRRSHYAHIRDSFEYRTSDLRKKEKNGSVFFLLFD